MNWKSLLASVLVASAVSHASAQCSGPFSLSHHVDGFVSGDTDISVPNGRIGFIQMPNSGSEFGQFDEIGDIFVYGRIWTSLLVRDGPTSGSFGPIGRIESFNAIGNNGASGGTGELWDISGFADIAAHGGEVEGIYCDGNFRSNLTIHGDLTSPIDIGGSLLSDLTITGTASAPISVGEDLGFYQVSPQALIEGNLTFSQSTSTPITSAITFQGDIIDGTILFNAPYAATLNIGGTFSSGTVIHAANATTPLSGQIILNSLNASCTWAGTVKYGSGGGTTISHTSGQYATVSSTWGGGAVGLAPFHMHHEDYVPPNGGEIENDLTNIKIRFYGPVFWSSTPVTIGRCDIAERDPVNEVADWEITGSGTREMTLTYKPGGVVTGSTVYAQSFSYEAEAPIP